MNTSPLLTALLILNEARKTAGNKAESKRAGNAMCHLLEQLSDAEFKMWNIL